MLRYLMLLLVLCPLRSLAESPQRTDGLDTSWLSLLGPNTTLTLGLSYGETVIQNQHLIPQEERLQGGDLWVGAAFHPRPAMVSPFLAGGLELGLLGASGTRDAQLGLEAIPEARLGLVVLMPMGSVTFPGVEVYGITGYRFVTHYRDNSLRIGAGLSLPVFDYIQGAILQSMLGFPFAIIPSMIEATYDLSSKETSFRVGFHF